ncbi:unnamed protein product [Caenorhabditis auriculariae]|uniref:Cation/H+ exchanger transmembrane domain-containing protein n=1 Tax=Caenorhabditis auriculariae TaxID=2777116 RepID=A0A8S1H2D3_9PELO|nr:unnamed protein product [Caenorhabditis auriculariae]
MKTATKNIASIKWNNVEAPLLILSWLICIVIAKTAFHSSNTLKRLFPESAVLIVLGLTAGYFIYEVFHIDLYLHPDLFFFYLLPPIVLEAGYFMPSHEFLANVWTILLYAVLGTLMNIVMIGK